MPVITKEEFDLIDKSKLKREEIITPNAIIYQYSDENGVAILIEADPKDGSDHVYQRC